MNNSPDPSDISVLKARVAALEELLNVHEEVVREQSDRLERALSDLRRVNSELEAEVRARTVELSDANRAMAEQAERWRVTLTSIGDGVIVTDRHGAVVSLNATAERLTGWSTSEAAGRDLDEVYVATNEDTGTPASDPALRAMKKGVIVGLANHTVLIARDGTRRPVDDSAAPIIDETGKVLGVVLVFRDIAQRRQMDRDREATLEREREARRKLENLNRAKDDFLSVLSHELRTPLTAVAGWTALLRDGQLDAEGTRKAIQVIDRNVAVQIRLITDLLDVSRMLAGKLTLEKRPVEVRELAEAATESLRPIADAAGVHLSIVRGAEALLVEGDSQRLQQIVHNLVCNAIKFTPKGGTVSVTVSREADSAVIRVQDTGIGIDPDFLPHVFKRFSQADSTMCRRHQGLGLGLSIAHHLVELHGGSIQATSAGVNCGSTFTVSLPLVLREAITSREASVRPSQAPFGTRLDGLRILVVEDDADTRELIVETLQRSGATVVSAADASEALAALDQFVPDVMIGDIGLPGVDGFELMRSIRARGPEGSGAIPAIALTAYVRPEDRARALDSGYQIHLSKPINLTALAASIRELTLRPTA
jgi:PAS domain S-box-containing protein